MPSSKCQETGRCIGYTRGAAGRLRTTEPWSIKTKPKRWKPPTTRRMTARGGLGSQVFDWHISGYAEVAVTVAVVVAATQNEIIARHKAAADRTYAWAVGACDTAPSGVDAARGGRGDGGMTLGCQSMSLGSQSLSDSGLQHKMSWSRVIKRLRVGRTLGR